MGPHMFALYEFLGLVLQFLFLCGMLLVARSVQIHFKKSSVKVNLVILL